MPYTPGTKRKADAGDPDTWRSFDLAVDTYRQGGWTGIGLELGYTGVVGVDLDDCLYPDGTPEPWAQEIIDELDSYTEVSVSGLGIHILAVGSIPKAGNKKEPVEIYAAGRFLALTGHVYGERNTIEDRHEQVTAFYQRVFGDRQAEIPAELSEPKEVSGDEIANAARWLDQLSLARCDDYDGWLHVGMALSELGPVGLALWERWSQKSDKYQQGDCTAKWRTIKPSEGITLNSLRFWAEEDAERPTTSRNGVSFRAANRTLSVMHDCVYIESRNGKRQVSTFMFYPRRLLVDMDQNGEDAILGDIVSSGKRWTDVVMPKSAFSSAASLCKALPSIYWQWTGTDNDTKLLLMYISNLLEEDGMPQAESTAIVGRHGNYWVTKDLTMDSSTVYTRGDAPILYRSPELLVRNKLSDTAPTLELSFPDEDVYSDLVKAISRDIVKCNHPDAVALTLGWFFASPLMSVFQDAGIRFPHLNIFGTKGSGKTTTVLRLFLPLMGLPRPSTWTPNTTMFVIRSLFSSTNGVPISFGEFRAATLQSARSDFLRILLMAYDTGRDARGQADLSTKTYDLLAPVVVDGEDALSDPALRERTIFVNLHPEDIPDGSPPFLAMERLLALPLADFAGRYLQYTLTLTKQHLAKLFEVYLARARECPLHLPDRMRRNMAVVLCGQHIYNDFVAQYGGTQLEITVGAFTAMVEAQGILLTDGRSRSSVDDFVEDMVAYLSSSSDYKYSFIARYDPERGVVWFHLPSAHAWWSSSMKRRGNNTLEFAALRSQLVERAMDSYAINETDITTAVHGRLRCFGVSLKRCREAGLNVSEKLSADIVELRGGV